MTPKMPYGGRVFAEMPVWGRDVAGEFYATAEGGEPLRCERCARKFRLSDYFEAGEDGAAHIWPKPCKRTVVETIKRWFTTTRSERRHWALRERVLAEDPCLQGGV